MNFEEDPELQIRTQAVNTLTSVYGILCIAQLVKNLPAMQETPVQFLDQEVPLEKG